MKAKRINWNEEKNAILKQSRNVCFEAVENAILENRILSIVPHHNLEKYPDQKILIVEINGYVHYVPFIETEDSYFLKSIIPSRKHNRQYYHTQDEL